MRRAISALFTACLLTTCGKPDSTTHNTEDTAAPAGADVDVGETASEDVESLDIEDASLDDTDVGGDEPDLNDTAEDADVLAGPDDADDTGPVPEDTSDTETDEVTAPPDVDAGPTIALCQGAPVVVPTFDHIVAPGSCHGWALPLTRAGEQHQSLVFGNGVARTGPGMRISYDGPLASVTTYATGLAGVADVDGDGLDDYHSRIQGVPFVSFQNPDSTFNTIQFGASVPTIPNSTPQTVLFGDLDGNGLLDLVQFIDFPLSQPEFRYYHQSSPRDFEPVVVQEVGPGILPRVRQPALFDANLDGRTDVYFGGMHLSGAPWSDVIPVLPQDTGGDFIHREFIHFDLDEDGQEELLASGAEPDIAVVFAGASGPVGTTMPSPHPKCVVQSFGDLTGDDRPDWVSSCSNLGDDDWRVFRHDGNGEFVQIYENSTQALGRTIAIDFDQDGDRDLVSGSGVVFENRLEQGEGFRTWAPPYAIPDGPILWPYTGPIHAFATGDFDGDGHLDVATASITHVRVIYGRGDGSFDRSVQLPRPPPVGSREAYSGWVRLQAIDLQGDGRDELLWGSLSPEESCQEFRSSGMYATGSDGTLSLVDSPLEAGQLFDVADINGDGELDLVATRAFEIDSQLPPLRSEECPASPNFCGTAEPAEGCPAYYKTCCYGLENSVSVTLSVGRPNQVSLPRVPLTIEPLGSGACLDTDGWSVQDARLVDFNGDGHRDLIAGVNLISVESILYVCEPNGWDGQCAELFEAQGWQYGTGGRHFIMLFPGDGSGGFGAGIPIHATNDGRAPVLGLADVDGDGHEDVLSSTVYGPILNEQAPDEVHRARYAQASQCATFLTPAYRSGSSGLGSNLNGDACADSPGGVSPNLSLQTYDPYLWVQLGVTSSKEASTSATLSVASPPQSEHYGVIPGDYNGDGLDDILVLGGPPYVMLNTTGQPPATP